MITIRRVSASRNTVARTLVEEKAIVKNFVETAAKDREQIICFFSFTRSFQKSCEKINDFSD